MAGVEKQPASGLAFRLRRLRALGRAAILFERVWPAIWPAICSAGFFLCAALLDLPAQLPAPLHVALLGIVAVVILFLLARGLTRIALPTPADADRRLERATGLRHRPLAALTDTQSGDDPAGAAIWREHVSRAIGQTTRLRIGLPRAGLAQRDPRALRAGLLVALAACLAIAGGDAVPRIVQSLTPSWPRAQAAPAVEVTAWVSPPGYTRLPPFFLKPAGGAVRAPIGSRLTVSVTGGTTMPTLSLDGDGTPLASLDRTSFQGERVLRQGGLLRLDRGGQTVASWELAILSDLPPTVAWTVAPGASPRGEQTRLPWRAEDDYGVVSLTAEFFLRDRPDLPPVSFPLALPDETTAKSRGVATQDLSAHPWAGLAVRGRLVARDAIGQIGNSTVAEFELPQRRFQNPVARLLVELRRGLTLHPEDRTEALGALDELVQQPALLGDEPAIVLNVEGIYYELVRDLAPSAIGETQQRMWELALRLEDGQAERSARALEAARQEVRQAMAEASRNPTPENREALDRALKQLEEAVRQHMAALMEQAMRDNTDERADPDAMRMDQRDMQRLAEAAREAAKAGRMGEAKNDLAELEAMLQQLQKAEAAGNPAGSAAGAKRRAERRERGQKQVGALQDMITREGGLLDQSKARANERPTPTSPSDAPSPQPEAQAAQKTDQRVQQALRRALGELMQQFGDLAGEVPAGLSDADGAMRDAVQALAQGSDPGAGAAQKKAIEALQRGGNEMGQTMARQFSPNGPGSGQESGEGEGEGAGTGLADNRQGDEDGGGRPRPGGPAGAGRSRDPLGRPQGQGTSGADESADVKVPEEQERQRAQAIQEELRRRGADRGRPQEELDYIDRLLRRF